MIPPLRKRRKGTNELYRRRDGVEKKLIELAALSREALIQRAQIRDGRHPDYIPSECLLHHLRNSKTDNTDKFFNRLFKILLDRLLSALPRPDHQSGAQQRTDITAERIRDRALGHVLEMLSKDRDGYDERLDFFEVSFNSAVAALRNDSLAPAIREQKRSASLTFDEETGEPSAEVERARGAFDPFDPAKANDEDYRLRVDAAIETLPQEQIRIVTMIAHGIPIESQDPSQPSVSTILGRSEKTIRTHRDKAYAAIRKAVQEETR
jgi:hypothetical protein